MLKPRVLNPEAIGPLGSHEALTRGLQAPDLLTCKRQSTTKDQRTAVATMNEIPTKYFFAEKEGHKC